MVKSFGVIVICLAVAPAAAAIPPASAPAAPASPGSSAPASSPGAADAAARNAPALSDLAVTRQGPQWTASVRLDGGLTDDMRERIDAGLETTVEYRLLVCRRRTLLPDQTLVKRRIECTVHYDALTQQYTLTRRVDGDLQETKVTDDKEVMIAFLTALSRQPLLPAADVGGGDEEYYVKAKSSFGLVWRFYLIPWALDTGWVRVPLQGTEGDGLATRP